MDESNDGTIVEDMTTDDINDDCNSILKMHILQNEESNNVKDELTEQKMQLQQRQYEDNVELIQETTNPNNISAAGCNETITSGAIQINPTIDPATGKTQYQCDVCKKIFAESKVLRRHLKIHSPNKPHVCNVCNMSFAESSNLTKHKKKHTGELRNIVGKPNLCSVCGK